jgi:hypothetical protein
MAMSQPLVKEGASRFALVCWPGDRHGVGVDFEADEQDSRAHRGIKLRSGNNRTPTGVECWVSETVVGGAKCGRYRETNRSPQGDKNVVIDEHCMVV